MSVQVKGSGTIGGLDEGLVVSGIVTATSFVGSGANLTGIQVGGATTLGFNDDTEVYIGSPNGLKISHVSSSTTNEFLATNGSIHFYAGAAIELRKGYSGNYETMLKANPDGALELYHDNQKKIETTTSGISVTGAITASGTIETTGSELKITGAEPRLTFTDTDNNPDFQLWANAQRFSIYDSTNSATRIRIDSSGNIGMNTTTTSDSTGNCRAYTFARTDVNGQVRIILKNQGTGFGNGAGYHQGIDGSNVFIENRSDGGYLDFSTNNSGSIDTRLRIISTGNFAIGNTHGAKKIHISHTGNQKILIDPNYNNNSGGSSNSEANANSVVDSVLIRTSFGDNAASQTNAGHKWGIKFQGYNGNDFTQNTSKIAAVYAVSEDEAGGYNRNVGLTFHTSPYNTTHREAMRINNGGAVMKPYNPAFAARLGSGNIDIATQAGNDMVFNTEEFDNSNSYDTSNGRFTAPVAGKYYFGVQLYAGFNGTGVRVLHAHFRVNGTSVAQTDMFGGASNHGGTHYHPTAAGHMIRSLNKNDYVTFNIGGFSHTGGQAILYASTGNRFFGYLVG